MGRIIENSMRTRLQDTMFHLNKRYKAALKDSSLQKAFDELWSAWANEQGAMIFANVLSPLDLLLLTAAVDNRREIEAIKRVLRQMNENKERKD